MSQPALPYPAFGVARGRADFHVSESNAEAVRWIDRWPDWPAAAFLLFGPQGCGKTHLARIWQVRAQAVLVDGSTLGEAAVPSLAAAAAVAVDAADRAPERALLHLYNACRERGRSMLLTARQPAGGWPVALPDLKSRLCAVAAVGIAAPDDALLAALLVKHFSDRQLRVRRGVVAYLVARMERSFAAAAVLAERLDAAGGTISVPLARRLLEETDQASLSSSEPGDA
jgi:chromosomal replication initiation ATPase DnaA